MNKRSMSGAALAAAIIALSCAPRTSPFTAADNAAIADTLRQITMGFQARIATLNADSVILAFADDPELAAIADAHLFRNKDSLLADARTRYAALRSLNLRWDTLRVAVLGPDAGVVTGIGHAVLTDKVGKVINLRAGATYVFARRQGQWKVVHTHASHAIMSP